MEVTGSDSFIKTILSARPLKDTTENADSGLSVNECHSWAWEGIEKTIKAVPSRELGIQDHLETTRDEIFFIVQG